MPPKFTAPPSGHFDIPTAAEFLNVSKHQIEQALDSGALARSVYYVPRTCIALDVLLKWAQAINTTDSTGGAL